MEPEASQAWAPGEGWAWDEEGAPGAVEAEEAAAVPWVDKNLCIGCGICVDACPVNSIAMKDGSAVIDMDLCIRCGECHDCCPEHAIRHDADLADLRIEQAVRNVEQCMAACEKYQGGPDAGQKCLQRFFRHYRNEYRVIDSIMERISSFKTPSSGA